MNIRVVSWVVVAALVAGAAYRLSANIEDPWAYLVGAVTIGLTLLNRVRGLGSLTERSSGEIQASADVALQQVEVLRERIDRVARSNTTAAGDETAEPVERTPPSIPRPAQREERLSTFEALRRKHERPALALVRPYPPSRSSTLRSHIGGLPSLPTNVAWPRAIDDNGCLPAGAPLHFLGQVDLGEQPWMPNDFPLKGTLLFFGALPDGYFWDTPNDARVIYDPTSSGVPTQPPEDLGAINGGYGHYQERYGDDDWLRCRTFPAWPLIGTRIGTMPDVGAFVLNASRDPVYAGYQDAHNDYRANQIASTLGASLDEIASRRLPTLAEVLASPGFPWTPRYIGLWARWMLLRGLRSTYRVELHRAVIQWRDWADSAGSDPLYRTKADEFAAFLAEQQLDLAEIDPSGRILRQLVSEAGGDPMLAASLPDALYDFAAEDHWPVNVRQDGPESGPDGKREWLVRHHQMGGHVPSTQEPKAIDYERICLMQFQTDVGLDMILCDMGEADFWIAPGDLEWGDFSDVLALTQGG